jgi:hypothetical protein
MVSRSKSLLAIEFYCGLAFFTAPWFAAIGTGCVAAGLLGVVPAPGVGCVVWSGLLGAVPPLLGVLVLFGVALALFAAGLPLVDAVPPLVGVVPALLAAAAWIAACANGDWYT